nr:MAG TPA: Cof subfamily of IIB subfamily of haloacid dehalogenase superfamily [Caudoviricetes sp.]
MIIAIDFDGTICQNKYPEIGEPMPLAIESIKELRERGHNLILWTCRQGDLLDEAIQWCKEHDMPFDLVNEHEPNNLKAFGGVSGNKVFANIYIDDRNLGGFPGWERAMELIKEAEAANLKWTKNEDFPQNNAVGYAKISESTQMVYFCFNHDFGYGAYWRCFRCELPLEVDPRGVLMDDLEETLREGFSKKEEAIMECEADFYKFLQERR